LNVSGEPTTLRESVGYIAILGESYDKVLEGKRQLEDTFNDFKFVPVMNELYNSETFKYHLIVLKKNRKQNSTRPLENKSKVNISGT
jgi:hypothetical protein